MSEPVLGWAGQKGDWREGIARSGHPGGQKAEPARGEKGREGSLEGREPAGGSSLPAPRLKEILASARYGVSLLERTLLMGRRSMSSSEDAAIKVGGRSRVARRAEREREKEKREEERRKGEEGRGRGSHQKRGRGEGDGRGRERGWGGKGKRGGKEERRREREREQRKEKGEEGEKENPLRICGLEQRSGRLPLAGAQGSP